ncbi:e6025a55-6e3b-4031-9693-cce8beea2fad [Sclerotinia trifoliorum]|uniref:E6025a55-6e3b-4031-9693-cce8beea2fad n=1 Tax=Sclerotinia trifoliorum TaxID=28548 RepID=A0A8H2ZL96_9HELO|nr:e6025a55-6e3b-4031-9693-cce8beea2fad [Sclerotinia trifoliorum]
MFSSYDLESSPQAGFSATDLKNTEKLLPGQKIQVRPRSRIVTLGNRYISFLGLIAPTIVSSLLLAADQHHVSISGGAFYDSIIQNRASAQIGVHILAGGLGLIQVAAIWRLCNYATRLRLIKRSIPRDLLNFWNEFSLSSMRWELCCAHFLLILLFAFACAVPCPLWAGAITPVDTHSSRPASILIPQYSNMNSVREWPSEINSSGPTLRSDKGFFTYSPAMAYQGLLSQSISTATTMDGSARQHGKYDNSKFVYIGRSFGVGASVGLADDRIFGKSISTGYTFQEVGYTAETSCMYNQSADFKLVNDGVQLFAARGFLPDSASAEFSVYLGHTSNSIVAFGVSADNTGYNPRYLGIAAGSDYGNLNMAQCRTQFKPTLFDVSVALGDKTITVTANNAPAVDIEPSGTLTHVLERQFELSSNDMSNIYQSVIGNALNFSIADYRAYVSSSHYTGSPLHELDINLGGIQNSVTAMIDDLLVSYASAQLMIANDTKTVDVAVTVAAVRFGQPVYIYLVFGFNLFLVLSAATYQPEEREEEDDGYSRLIFDSTSMGVEGMES